MINEVTAIIPARSGSKGVFNKNIRPLAGFPLIAYAIAAAKLSKEIERTVVSTDSEEFAEIARNFGAETPFLRPAVISGDKSTDKEFINHAIEWFITNEGGVVTYFILLRPTTPLRKPEVIDEAIKLIKNNLQATSLRSGHLASESPYKWFIKNKNNYFQPAMGNYTNDAINMPRQTFPEVYIPDGYVDIIKTAFVQKADLLFGNKMLSFISPVSHEIDTEEDCDLLNFEIKKRGSILLDYLKKYYGHKNKI